MKRLQVIFLTIGFAWINVIAQSTPSSKGAFIPSLSGNFTYIDVIDDDEGIDNALWTINTEVNYLLLNNLMAGAGASYYGEKVKKYQKL